MPTPRNAPYKLLQRRRSKHYPRLLLIHDGFKIRRKNAQVRVGRGVYEYDERGCIINVTAERRIRKELGLSPRQYRMQRRAARRAGKLEGLAL